MIGFSALSKISFRNVWRNKKRSFLTLGAIAVGVLSTSMLSALQAGARAQIEEDSVRNLLGHIKIANTDYFDDQVAINSIEPLEGLLNLVQVHGAKVSSRVKVSAIIMSERKSRPITLVGIDPKKEEKVSILDQKEYVETGEPLKDEGDQGIILGRKLIEDLKTQVGKRIVILTQDIDGKVSERGFRIKGAYKSELEATEKAYAVSGIRTIQNMLKMGNKVSDISIVLDDIYKIDSLRTKLKVKFPNADIRTWTEVEPFLQAVVKLQNGVLILWYGIVLLAVFFGVVNTLFMMVFEREREFCLYRALGLGNWSLTFQIMMEVFVLLILGSISGMVLSYFVVGYLSVSGIPLDMFSDGAGLLGIRSIVYPKLLFSKVIFFVSLIFIVCILGSIFPARKAVGLRATEGLTK